MRVWRLGGAAEEEDAAFFRRWMGNAFLPLTNFIRFFYRRWMGNHHFVYSIIFLQPTQSIKQEPNMKYLSCKLVVSLKYRRQIIYIN